MPEVGSFEDDKEVINWVAHAKNTDPLPAWWPLGFYKAVARMLLRLVATRVDHTARISALEERVEFLTPEEYRSDD